MKCLFCKDTKKLKVAITRHDGSTVDVFAECGECKPTIEQRLQDLESRIKQLEEEN